MIIDMRNSNKKTIITGGGGKLGMKSKAKKRKRIMKSMIELKQILMADGTIYVNIEKEKEMKQKNKKMSSMNKNINNNNKQKEQTTKDNNKMNTKKAIRKW